MTFKQSYASFSTFNKVVFFKKKNKNVHVTSQKTAVFGKQKCTEYTLILKTPNIHCGMQKQHVVTTSVTPHLYKQ